jgi:hypothetical protein
MKLDLGPYVVSRERADGTFRVSFECPSRLRPQGWPATYPLPRENRTGILSNEEEVSRIRAEALALHAELVKQRSGAAPEQPRSWQKLVRLWHETSKYQQLAAGTKHNYAYYTARVLKVLAENLDIQPSTAKESDLERVLAHWNYSPDMKVDSWVILRHLMKKAVKEKWRSDNPMAEIPCIIPPKESRRVILWEFSDVETTWDACLRAGHPEIAGIIRTAWRIGQRLGDIRKFEHGNQYVDGHFCFKQNKTKKQVSIPAPPELRELLDKQSSGFLFPKPGTNRPHETYLSLGQAFRCIRDTIPEYKDRRIVMRNLRHSAVVEFARAGAEIYDIASVTGHSFNTVYAIIEHYLPRHSEFANRAMALREQMLKQGGHLAVPAPRNRTDRTLALRSAA